MCYKWLKLTASGLCRAKYYDGKYYEGKILKYGSKCVLYMPTWGRQKKYRIPLNRIMPINQNPRISFEYVNVIQPYTIFTNIYEIKKWKYRRTTGYNQFAFH